MCYIKLFPPVAALWRRRSPYQVIEMRITFSFGVRSFNLFAYKDTPSDHINGSCFKMRENGLRKRLPARWRSLRKCLGERSVKTHLKTDAYTSPGTNVPQLGTRKSWAKIQITIQYSIFPNSSDQ